MPDPRDPAAFHDAARLCLDCGLCCDGTLFDQVELQPGDLPKALSARGLKIKKGKWFNQPCAGLCGTLCQLYQHRPTRCRQFQCGQYRGVAAGEISFETAADRIRAVREEEAGLKARLTAAGGGNVRKSLARRHATALEAQAGVEGATAPLTESMNRFRERLEAWFGLG